MSKRQKSRQRQNVLLVGDNGIAHFSATLVAYSTRIKRSDVIQGRTRVRSLYTHAELVAKLTGVMGQKSERPMTTFVLWYLTNLRPIVPLKVPKMQLIKYVDV